MTPSQTISRTRATGESSAFRSVFADPEEKLLLILSESGNVPELKGVIEAAEGIRNEGTPLRMVIYGDSSSLFPVESRIDASRIGFLETWAEPLLPTLLSTADAVVALGDSIRTIAQLSESPLHCPFLEGQRADIQGLRSALVGEHGKPESQEPILNPSRTNRTRTDYVLQNDWGIGDELLLSGVAREIVRAFPDMGVWIRSRHGFRFPKFVRSGKIPGDARRIETIYQNPTLYGPDAHSPFPRHLVQQMLDKFALDTGLKVKALDVRPELDLGDSGHRPDSTVILHTRPNSRLSSKDWGLKRWEKLSGILNKSGVRIRQVGGKDEPLLREAEDLRGIPIGDLQDVFVRSTAVVCVVGFLMHLAEATRTPAVVIYGGREHPAIDGYPDQIHLSSEALPCRGRWGCHLAPDFDCPHGMKCMEHITPELVADKVLHTLSQKGVR